MKNNYSDKAVANVNLRSLDIEELIDFAIAKKKIADLAGAELDVIKKEMQERAISFQDDRHIKFTEWHGSDKSLASITTANTMEIKNFTKLKSLLGKEFVGEKIKEKRPVKYVVEDNFKKALIALKMGDYESKTSIDEVIDSAGWCENNADKRALLKKSLKGDYKKDKKAVLTSLNLSDEECDIDTELFLIYQIKNFELIKAFFDVTKLEEIRESLEGVVDVSESVRIGLKAV